MHWVAHDPGAVNFVLLELERAATVAEAIAVGQRSGVPAQNMVAGDAAGHIGWTDRRRAARPRGDLGLDLPGAGEHAPRRTPGARSPRRPRIRASSIRPPGQIATANARQLAGAGYGAIGDGGADLGARQRQLRDSVTALGPGVDEAGDVRRVPRRPRALPRAVARPRPAGARRRHRPPTGQRAEFKRLLETTWTGRASIDSVGYRLTRGFVGGLYARLFGGVDEALKEVDKRGGFARATPRWPAVIARLLDEKPPGWLPQGSADWRAVQLAAIDDVIASVEKEGTPLDQATWGKRNTPRIAHPMAAALPLGMRWLAAPAEPMPGDSHMPRVAAPDFGQSERFAVSPGREASGVFNMPGGQSGHPLAAWFLAGHADWVAGRPTPLLPGPATHTLRFVPR